MTHTSAATVRLTPELQAEYQQTYNDPARKGSPEWRVAAKSLVAAGLIQAEPSAKDDLSEAVPIVDSSTAQQTP